MTRRERPTLRLLFDELLPWRVAEALLVLGFHTSYVGNHEHGQPKKRASDADVIRHAMKTNQIVVTSNHDMVMLCAEKGQSVVWVDPRGRQFKMSEYVPLFFKEIEEWQRLLEAEPGPVCLRVMRTRTVVMQLDGARRLAERRMKRLIARNRGKRKPRTETLGQMRSAG